MGFGRGVLLWLLGIPLPIITVGDFRTTKGQKTSDVTTWKSENWKSEFRSWHSWASDPDF